MSPNVFHRPRPISLVPEDIAFQAVIPLAALLLVVLTIVWLTLTFILLETIEKRKV